jgi:pimeloyl-ACP methyl ester carboxylesterase
VGYPLRARRRSVHQQQKVDGYAWKSNPSWFIIAKDDQTVHPDLQRFVSKRMGATVVEVKSSHVIMLSHPDLVIDVIRKAAASVAAKQGKAA